jgi:beta-lactamase class A
MPKQLLYVLSSFVLGVALTWLAISIFSKPRANQLEMHAGAIDMINPLLTCGDFDPPLIQQSAFESRLNKLVKELKASSDVSDISISYRDLNNGPTFTINGELTYSGASLLKVPILIGYLRLIERDPNLKKTKIKYDPSKHDVEGIQLISFPEKLVPQKEYTVEELLMRMITLSDNSAMMALRDFKPETGIQQTLKDMGVPLAKDGDDLIISVRNYATILRILYNATFINKDSSNLALKILSMSRFTGGLKAGVPADIKVADKFGERHIGMLMQFHDCGIIYYPRSPYLLCVMSRGLEMEKLVSSVAKVSKAVFEQVSEQ